MDLALNNLQRLICQRNQQVANSELFIFIKMDLVLNNLQGLICHKTKSNLQKMVLNSKMFIRKIYFKSLRE